MNAALVSKRLLSKNKNNLLNGGVVFTEQANKVE